MAKNNGSTPPDNRRPSSEEMERLEHFYSLPIAEQTAFLADDPQLANDNILRHDGQVVRTSNPTRCDNPANPPELSRLHRLAQDEADLVFDFRLLSTESKQVISALARSMGCCADHAADNVVSIRTAG